jgi:nucleotidyltransferase substrate binding protein (TIGR01987 family)
MKRNIINWSMLQIPSTNEKIVDRFENYAKAFTKLSELHINPIGEVDEIVRDAFFQRYEFCVEIAWKLVKDILEFEQITIKTPREAIKEAVKAGVLDDFYVWDEMLTTRNFSSHNYDERKIIAIFPTMYDIHYPKLAWLMKFVQSKYIS